jgi:hypothetical protein
MIFGFCCCEQDEPEKEVAFTQMPMQSAYAPHTAAEIDIEPPLLTDLDRHPFLGDIRMSQIADLPANEKGMWPPSPVDKASEPFAGQHENFEFRVCIEIWNSSLLRFTRRTQV